MSTTNKYSVGDTVVHATHGVGTIRGIQIRDFGNGKVTKFYIININEHGGVKKVFIPTDVNQERLRKVMSKSEAKEIMAILNGVTKLTDVDHQTWNRRYREYMEMLSSGNPKDTAEIVAQLTALKADKDLNFGERKLLEQATRLLKTELSAVEGLDLVFLG